MTISADEKAEGKVTRHLMDLRTIESQNEQQVFTRKHRGPIEEQQLEEFCPIQQQMNTKIIQQILKELE